MTHAVLLLTLLSLVCLVNLGQCAVYPTLSFDGWEVIWLDRPSYLSQIHHSHTEALLYVYGEDTLRLVFTYPNFTVDDYPPADWHQSFIALYPFHNGTDLWGIGPSLPADTAAPTEGYSLPLALVGPSLWHTQDVDGLDGYTFFSLWVDDSNHSDILSYLIGWLPISENPDQVAFGIVRTHVDLNAPFALRHFKFNATVDTLPLYQNRYYPYSQHNKPHIHYQNATSTLIIVDPPTFNVFTVKIGPGTFPLSKLKSARFAMAGKTITSSFYHPDTNLLYVGYAAQGTGNGSLVAIEMGTLTVQHSIDFYGTLANPRALAIDEPTDTIYVGFNGGDAVVKLDYLLNIQGFQRVPDYLVHLEGARVGVDHVFFITNEQHSKVIRVNKTDFCPNLCPHFGYCSKGKCLCDRHFQLSNDGHSCTLLVTGISTTEKGAAVALGVLFAITFVVAVLGWVLYWQARKGGYQAV